MENPLLATLADSSPADSLVYKRAFDFHRDLRRLRLDKVAFQFVAPDDHEFFLVRFWQIPNCQYSVADQLALIISLIFLSARDRSCGFDPFFNLPLRSLE
jgi:hypothetical protein